MLILFCSPGSFIMSSSCFFCNMLFMFLLSDQKRECQNALPQFTYSIFYSLKTWFFFHCLCRPHQFIGLINHGVAFNGPCKQAFLVIGTFPDGFAVSGKVGYGVNKPVSVFANIL